MSKVSAKWIPRNLNMQDNQQRVETSQELLEVFNANTEYFHTSLVTEDETWLHQRRIICPFAKMSTLGASLSILERRNTLVGADTSS